MRFFLIFCTLLSILFLHCKCTKFYSHTGEWIKGSKDQCNNYHLCTYKNNLTWVENRNPMNELNRSVLSPSLLCDRLTNKGIKRISFNGDSYMRNLFHSFVIFMSNEYERSVYRNHLEDCTFHRDTLNCSVGFPLSFTSANICDKKIKINVKVSHHKHFFDLSECNPENGTIVVFSYGNHAFQQREGVNDPQMHIRYYQQNHCSRLKKYLGSGRGDIGEKCSVWWMSTHQRFSYLYKDEKPEKIDHFNRKMRDFFQSGQCGPINYIDVFNMTQKLVDNHLKEAYKMTYDGMHWGTNVNLIKLQILFRALNLYQ